MSLQNQIKNILSNLNRLEYVFSDIEDAGKVSEYFRGLRKVRNQVKGLKQKYKPDLLQYSGLMSLLTQLLKKVNKSLETEKLDSSLLLDMTTVYNLVFVGENTSASYKLSNAVFLLRMVHVR